MGELFKTTYKLPDKDNVTTAIHNPTPYTDVQHSEKRGGPSNSRIDDHNMTTATGTAEFDKDEEEAEQYAQYAW